MFTLTLVEAKMEIQIGCMLHRWSNEDDAKTVTSDVLEQYDAWQPRFLFSHQTDYQHSNGKMFSTAWMNVLYGFNREQKYNSLNEMQLM